MGLSYQPKAITLSFKEGKPVTYKAQQVTYPGSAGDLPNHQVEGLARLCGQCGQRASGEHRVLRAGTHRGHRVLLHQRPQGRAPRGGRLLPRREVEVRAHGGEPQREAGGAVRASIRRLPRTPTRWVRNPLANAIRLRGTIDKMKALLKQKDNNPQG